MAEVSKRTGIAASTLSRVESNGASLSYEKLMRLCEGLSVDIAEFFRPRSNESAPVPVTARRSLDVGAGPIVDTPVYLQRYLHTDISGKKLIPVITERLLQSPQEFGDFHHHPGEEFIYVLSGTLQLYTEFYAPMEVRAGQSVYIDSTMGHAYIRSGSESCRILSVMTPPDGGASSHRVATPADSVTASAEASAPLPRGRSARAKTKRAR